MVFDRLFWLRLFFSVVVFAFFVGVFLFVLGFHNVDLSFNFVRSSGVDGVVFGSDRFFSFHGGSGSVSIVDLYFVGMSQLLVGFVVSWSSGFLIGALLWGDLRVF